MMQLLGMPVTQALSILHAMGKDAQVEYTCAPRHPVTEGTDRVIRVREDGKILTAARFPEGNFDKEEPESE